MLRRTFRRGLAVGLIGGVVLAASKLFGAKRPEPVPAAARTQPWPPLQQVPAVEDRAEVGTTSLHLDPDAPARAWVDPVDGECPDTHPVKAKLSSKIFHLPGMMNYERTNPDRCYRDAAAAEADGLRPAKR